MEEKITNCEKLKNKNICKTMKMTICDYTI